MRHQLHNRTYSTVVASDMFLRLTVQKFRAGDNVGASIDDLY
jgi:hypothetical protein